MPITSKKYKNLVVRLTAPQMTDFHNGRDTEIFTQDAEGLIPITFGVLSAKLNISPDKATTITLECLVEKII